jgi:putative flippase GtrA
MIARSLVRFTAVGGANTAVGLGGIWVAKEVIGVGDAAANISGYVVGVTVSFLLNKRWSFEFRGKNLAASIRFLLVFAGAYTANLCTVLALLRISGRESFWYQVCGVIPYTMIFYAGCRWYAFPSGAARSRHNACVAMFSESKTSVAEDI